MSERQKEAGSCRPHGRYPRRDAVGREAFGNRPKIDACRHSAGEADDPLRMRTESPSFAFEDFTVGRVLETGKATVTREATLRFAAEFDPQPFHLDEAAAERSLFKGLSASGWHTCAIAMRLMCDAWLLDSTSLGSPGLDRVKWLAPVRPGDTLQVRMTVLEARTMASRPGIGLVRSQWDMFNQRGERVLDMEGWGMFRRRDALAPPPAGGRAESPT